MKRQNYILRGLLLLLLLTIWAMMFLPEWIAFYAPK